MIAIVKRSLNFTMTIPLHAALNMVVKFKFSFTFFAGIFASLSNCWLSVIDYFEMGFCHYQSSALLCHTPL